MSKPFFYRITAADFLAAVVTVPEQDRAAWVLSLALDMVSGDGDNAKSDFAKTIISEAGSFRKKKSDAAKAKWGGEHEPTTTRSKRLSDARKKGTHHKDEWAEMVEFFNYTCVKCLGEKQKGDVVKDHIKPIYQGGSDSILNLQPLCTTCNSSKGSDSTDHRPEYCLQNDCKMPAKWVQTPSSSSSSTEAVAVQKQKIKPLKTVRRFTPPTLTDVESYCQERNKGVDSERWMNHYEANGWMVGKNKMKDWKAAVRTWEKKQEDDQDKYGNYRIFTAD